MITARALLSTHPVSLAVRVPRPHSLAPCLAHATTVLAFLQASPGSAAHLTMASRRSARLSAQAEAKPVAGSASSMPPPPAPAAKSRKRKASSPAENGEPLSTAPTTPTTPKRRVQKTAVPPLPATPTPSAVRLIAEPAAVNGVDTPPTSRASSSRATATTTTPKPRSRAVARLADPKGTNAPLLSPETSRVVASKPNLEDASPSSQPKMTTANILSEACAHLVRTEPRLKPLLVDLVFSIPVFAIWLPLFRWSSCLEYLQGVELDRAEVNCRPTLMFKKRVLFMNIQYLSPIFNFLGTTARIHYMPGSRLDIRDSLLPESLNFCGQFLACPLHISPPNVISRTMVLVINFPKSTY